jgi:citrate lyase subunit beta/citryl-CoA lyase
MPADGAAPQGAGVRLRSLLFVPGDRPERFDKAAASGADALILDLEDAVSADRKPAAREAIAARLAGPRAGVMLFVRINPLDSAFFDADLALLGHAVPDAIVLPKAEGAASIDAFARRLPNAPPILPIATETPAALFQLGSYAGVAARLCGLTWGAEDLPAAIGASTAREADGGYTPPYQMVRSLALFAAHAAAVAAIETVYPAFRDLDGLARYAGRGAADGFTGMMAIHPDQVAVINAAFTPSAEAIARAEAVVAAFGAQPGRGAVQLDGSMLDAPHLRQAQRLLDRAGQI